MKKLEECLRGREDSSCIFPFLWLHGEPHERIAEEIDAIARYGITEFCAESRPHPDFCGEQWWSDIGFILDYARQRGMRVWLFDDCHFPTGHANFYIDSHPELRRKHMRLEYRDIGTVSGRGTLVLPDLEDDERILRVYAYRRGEEFDELVGEGIDLTAGIVENSLLRFELESGIWRICYLVDTLNDSVLGSCYMDVLNPESCDAMIKAVYEPHYEHLAEYFGNTLIGFFSDEPCFANFLNDEGYNGAPSKNRFLPYSEETFELMAKELGKTSEDIWARVPRLWMKHPDNKELYLCFMQTVSEIYQRNVSSRLADWCHDHGVQYIGHVLEDMGCHQHIGYGAGNMFKALRPQDMSGIDIVLNQINPYFTDMCHQASIGGGFADPSYFNYTHGKLGSSLAHITPHMKNRAICEIFGAFGWAEGVPFMKQMADKMLVSGINHFIPHGFTAQDGDEDCPPHFHSEGVFLQEAYFDRLISYMKKSSHLLSGQHISGTAVAYIPDGEWSGGEFMPIDEVAKILTRSQLDFDIVPLDISDSFVFENNTLLVNGESYKALVVPYCEHVSHETARKLEEIAVNIPVIFVGKPPVNVNSVVEGFEYVFKKNLVSRLEALGARDIKLERAQPYIRVYHSHNDDGDVYLFHNDDMWNGVETFVDLGMQRVAFYDAWDNKKYKPEFVKGKLRLCLAEGGSIIAVTEENADESYPYYPSEKETEIECDWRVSYQQTENDAPIKIEKDTDISLLSGIFTYETELELNGSYKLLELQEIGEVASLYINGELIGERVGEGFRFPIGMSFNGKTSLTVKVIGNAGLLKRDRFSTSIVMPFSGCGRKIKLS